MIGYLVGQPKIETPDEVLLLVGGVGYELHCSANTIREIEGLDLAHVFVQTVLREDALHLYGFSRRVEKNLFLALLKVNGIGPKTALNILSATTLEHLFKMIEDGDVKALSKLPKVGKKTAEQMILSLKGKLTLVEDGQPVKKNENRQAIVSALVNLGFRIHDVETVVENLDSTTDIQEGVRQALVALTN